MKGQAVTPKTQVHLKPGVHRLSFKVPAFAKDSCLIYAKSESSFMIQKISIDLNLFEFIS